MQRLSDYDIQTLASDLAAVIRDHPTVAVDAQQMEALLNELRDWRALTDWLANVKGVDAEYILNTYMIEVHRLRRGQGISDFIHHHASSLNATSAPPGVS